MTNMVFLAPSLEIFFFFQRERVILGLLAGPSLNFDNLDNISLILPFGFYIK